MHSFTPSKLLAQVHRHYQHFPVHVIGTGNRQATLEEMRHFRTTYRASPQRVYSFDYLLALLSFDGAAKGSTAKNPNKEVLKKAHQYLWASANGVIASFAEWKTTPGRNELIQQINDNCTLDQIEEILLGAYMLALSEEDPQDEWFTLEQQMLRQRTLEEAIVQPTDNTHVFVTVGELKEWHASMDTFRVITDVQSAVRFNRALEAIAKKIATATSA